MLDNHNYTVLITGANSEIGVEACHQYIDDGATVIALVHCDYDNLKQFPENSINIIKIDFSDSCNIENFIKNNNDLLNSVDIFISLASVRKPIEYSKINSADLLYHFSINTIPVILLTQFFGRSMSEKSWGRIVIGSSIGVKFGGGFNSYCYSITKYASELIPNVAKKWSKNNVLINIVRIGVTSTDKFMEIGDCAIEARKSLIPMNRIANSKEIASSIYWLGSKENTYITGQNIAVSGGE